MRNKGVIETSLRARLSTFSEAFVTAFAAENAASESSEPLPEELIGTCAFAALDGHFVTMF